MNFGFCHFNFSSASAQENPPSGDASQEIWDFSLTGHDDQGNKRWEVSGDTASLLSNETIDLRQVKATSFGSSGTVTMSSKTGSFDKMTNHIQLQEEVLAESSDGTKLRSERIEYQAETGELQTDAFVEIEQNTMRAFGYGARAAPDEKRLELEKNITMIARPSTTITCKGPLSIDYQNEISVFENEVRVVDSKGEITSDRMEVFFDRDLETIQRVIATGDVRIMRGDNVTRSDRAEYDVLEGKVTLTQRPQLQVTQPDE